MNDKINKIINKMSLEEKVGQLLVYAFHGTEFNEQLLTFINEFHIGGVILFARNIIDMEQTKKLNDDIQKNSSIPLFIGVDQEGGTVQRIIGTDENNMTIFPGAMAISAAGESTYDLCRSVGEDLKHMGFNMNFAPVADINNNYKNPVINSRSYSDDPAVCAKYVIEASKGYSDAGIIPFAKHFPGHGNTSVDSHVSLPTVESDLDELTSVELLPYSMAIKEGLEGIMVSHIRFTKIDPVYPATLSKKIIRDLLIDKMNFKGLIITDSLTMGAIYNTYSFNDIVRLSCNSGIDLLVFCGKASLEEQRKIYKAFITEAKEGRISIDRINESVYKILKYKEEYLRKKINIKYSKTMKKEMGKTISYKSITLVKDKGLFPISGNILVLFPKMKIMSLVDNSNNDYISLGKVLNDSGIKCDELIYSEDTDYLNEINTLKKTKNYDRIILATINVKKDDYQTNIFKNLDINKTIVVSLRSPYDWLYLERVESYVCLYEPTFLALNSFAQCVKNNQFTGKLPVKYINKEA